MADDQPDITQDPEDEILLAKVDAMLHRHRQEQSSLMQPVEETIVMDTSVDFPEQLACEADVLPAGSTEATDIDGIPVLTDRVVLAMDEWPSQTEISELLYFAFNAALREACISLSPAERLTLIQALGKRLPKNI